MEATKVLIAVIFYVLLTAAVGQGFDDRNGGDPLHKANKRPTQTQSRDRYRLLRTLRSKPVLSRPSEDVEDLFHKLQTAHFAKFPNHQDLSFPAEVLASSESQLYPSAHNPTWMGQIQEIDDSY